MALMITINDPRGFTMQDAYCRVEGVSIENKQVMKFQLRCYKDAAFGTAFSDSAYSCEYEVSEVNPYEQAYNYLKSLSEFASAADV